MQPPEDAVPGLRITASYFVPAPVYLSFSLSPDFIRPYSRPRRSPSSANPILPATPFMLLFDHEVPLWWVVGGAVFALVSPLLLFAAAIMSHIKIKPDRHRTVTILVLGDIGRSPRMMYHAESFAKSGWNTFLIGYGGQCSSFLSEDVPADARAR